MRREDCQEMFRRIPVSSHPQVNLSLRNGALLAVDTVVRFEPHYLVFRGREGGSTDEGRAFFVPYEEICYLKIERVTRVSELRQMYGEMTGTAEGATGGMEPAGEAAPSVPAAVPLGSPSPAAPVLNPTDPAAIARQNLLNRIRAARASTTSTATRPTEPDKT